MATPQQQYSGDWEGFVASVNSGVSYTYVDLEGQLKSLSNGCNDGVMEWINIGVTEGWWCVFQVPRRWAV